MEMYASVCSMHVGRWAVGVAFPRRAVATSKFWMLLPMCCRGNWPAARLMGYHIRAAGQILRCHVCRLRSSVQHSAGWGRVTMEAVWPA